MIKIKKENPAVKAGWLRALIFIVAFAVASTTAITVYFLTGNRGQAGSQGLPDLQSAPVVSMTFAISLLIVFIFRRWIDRKSFLSLGFRTGGFISDAIAGATLAVFIVGAACLLLKATGHLKWMDIILDPRSLFIAFGTIVVAAVSEEMVFRGYILGNLLESFSIWPSLMISSLLFMIFHWSSSGLFPLINGFLFGMIMGLNYAYTRNLWFSICFHAGWKFMEGPLMGYGGIGTGQTLLQTDMHGDENVTGGAYGLEGSAILMGVAILSLLTLYIFLQKRFSPQSQPVPGRI